MHYSTLHDARSYFESPTFERSLGDADVLARELAKLEADGEGENILDAVRELAAFQQLRRLANRKLRAFNPRKPRLNESQTTAIEYLFGIRRLGPASWGAFEQHVNRTHRVGRYRIGRQLKALEDAGIVRTHVDRDTAAVTVELVLAGVKRAPGSAPLAAIGDVVLVGKPRPEGAGVKALVRYELAAGDTFDGACSCGRCKPELRDEYGNIDHGFVWKPAARDYHPRACEVAARRRGERS
jgi:hypothetical protein